MCGIAGIVGPPRPRADLEAEARALLARLAHRGPDDEGLELFATGPLAARDPALAEVALGHRRLSIIDLSAAGHQPMASEDGRFRIVFNGEIYNYVELRADLEREGARFRTASDTEVLLAAWMRWGRAALPRLTGMFAFAVLDRERRRLTLVRDAFGVKPLYVAPRAEGLAFASEVPALLALPGIPRRADPRRVFRYLRFGVTDDGGSTFLAGVRQLPAGHLLDVDLADPARARPERWWRIDPDARLGISFEDAADRLRALFLESVRLHLRSDVPLGVALSGGIDSSAIVAAMRAVGGPSQEIVAFGYVAEDAALSEERWIDLAAGAAGARIHRVSAGPEALVRDLDGLIERQGEPFASTSIYAQRRVFEAAAAAGVKVMLDGQGADELLAGYRGFLGARLVTLLRRGRLLSAARLGRSIAALPGPEAPLVAGRAAALLLPAPLEVLARRTTGRDLAPPWLDERWFRDRGVALESPWRHSAKDALREDLRRAVAETSLPMLLRYEDRSSMTFSIESRVPFLTPAIATLLAALPEEHLVARDGTTKAVFRRAMRGLVPDAILDRRDKIGFATPERAWLGAVSGWVERVLSGDALARVAPLRPLEVRAEWRRTRAGARRFDTRIWRWLNLLRWAEVFDVSFD